MGTPFLKLRFFFHKVSFIIETLFSPLRETLYAGRINLFAEAALRARCGGFRRRPRNSVLGVHLSGSQKDLSLSVINQDCPVYLLLPYAIQIYMSPKTEASSLKADSHIACRAHAVPMPRPCRSPAMPCR